MSYFVSPPDETSLAFDAEDLACRLAEWEGISFRDPNPLDAGQTLLWSVPLRFGEVYGSLDEDGQVIHLDGFLGDCALFALWLRTIVPEVVELLFYDENYSADVALVAFTREADLLRAFGT